MRDGATVTLVGDGPTGGIEVFMVQRNQRSEFVGGAHVLPGRAVDEADRGAAHEELWVGPGDAAGRARLGIDRPRLTTGSERLR